MLFKKGDRVCHIVGTDGVVTKDQTSPSDMVEWTSDAGLLDRSNPANLTKHPMIGLKKGDRVYHRNCREFGTLEEDVPSSWHGLTGIVVLKDNGRRQPDWWISRLVPESMAPTKFEKGDRVYHAKGIGAGTVLNLPSCMPGCTRVEADGRGPEDWRAEMVLRLYLKGMTVLFKPTGNRGIVIQDQKPGCSVDVSLPGHAGTLTYTPDRLEYIPPERGKTIVYSCSHAMTESKSVDWRYCQCCNGDNRGAFLLYSAIPFTEPVIAWGHRLGCKVAKPGTPID